MTVEDLGYAFVVRGGYYGRKRGTLIQTDWDYPRIACDLGWNMRRVQRNSAGKDVILKAAPARDRMCDHSRTDGTVNCPDCGVTASSFIRAAGDYIASKAR